MSEPRDYGKLAIQRLQAIVDAGHGKERDQALDALLDDNLALYGVRNPGGQDSGGVQKLLKRLDSSERTPINKAAGDVTKTHQAEVRAQGSQAHAVVGQSINELIDAPKEWPIVQMPMGWSASHTGIIHKTKSGGTEAEEPFCSDPWFVIGSMTDFDTGEERLIIGFRRNGRWGKRIVDRAKARDSRGVGGLAAWGVDVMSTRAALAVEWVAACEAQYPPKGQVTNRVGWHGDVYVSGPGCSIELDDPNGDYSGWRPKGTWEGWLDAVSTIAKEPVVALALIAAAVAPLLRFMDLDHLPLIDLSGPKCSGKTTAARVAGSGWGRPDEQAGGVLRTWDSTLVGMERRAARTHDAPMLLDDSARCTNIRILQDAIYALCQGRGRERGTGDQGGLQRVANWRNVTISTGEGPLIARTEAGGARGRCLSITKTPACSSREAAAVLERGIDEHHGHLALRLAEAGLRLGYKLRDRHRQALGQLAAKFPQSDTRMLSTAAAIEVAGGVLFDLGVPIGEAWLKELDDSCGDSSQLDDQGGRALQAVQDYIERFPHSFYGHENAVPGSLTQIVLPPSGYVGVWRCAASTCIGFFPKQLSDILRQAGHQDASPIIEVWKRDGILKCNKKSQYSKKFKGVTKVVYAIYLDKLPAHLAGEEAED